jgi:hypothetical protein
MVHLSAGQEWAFYRWHAPAYMHEIGVYLSALPRFYVIACSLHGQAWVCVPYNASDATQRSWPNGQPRQVHLVFDHIQPFEVLIGGSWEARCYTKRWTPPGLYNIQDAANCHSSPSELSVTNASVDFVNAWNIVHQRG